MNVDVLGRVAGIYICTSVALTGCAGSAGVSASTPATHASSATTVPVSFKIYVPTASGNAQAHASQYVSGGTQSVTVIITAPGQSSGAPALITCSAGTCSGAVSAPAGYDSVTVNLYTGASGTGNLLSTGTTNITVRSNALNAVNLTFNPVVASIALQLSQASLPAGAPGTSTLSVVTKDSAGDVIVGPGSFVDASGNPLTITVAKSDSGGNGSTSLAATSFTNPANSSTTVTYSGGSMYTGTYTATSSRAITGATAGTALSITGVAIVEHSSGISGGAAPYNIVAGPDGNLWFTELGSSRIARITTDAVVTEFSAGITGGANPRGITVGPDGNVWFAETGIDRIGRITTSGTVTEFSAGITAGAAPYGIVTGPDGNLWFTENGKKKVGRITTAGTVTEFTAGITGNDLSDIVVGSDNNLWFTEWGSDKVARVTTAGVVTEFSSGITPGAQPIGITAGPDGNLWFTENSQPNIGRITTSGAVTEFTTGITGFNLDRIIAGPDGNMWFTEEGSDKIARITTAGVITEFSSGITSGAAPIGITTGSDGNLWFTEDAGNAIDRAIY